MFTLAISPYGHLHVTPATEREEDASSVVYDKKIIMGFSESPMQGLFQLITTKTDNNWPKPLHYWRAFITQYINALCHQNPFLDDGLEPIEVPDSTTLQEWCLKIPPMPGAEYCTVPHLTAIWQAFDHWISNEIKTHPTGPKSFFTEKFQGSYHERNC